ncbi:MAG: hypothetical protein M1818_008163 [Claussenomyces sp. TS43310]|nr:MAG: hypothetical protein M1818_008163 [Claussenomyces sp. TS43310]
MDPHAWPASPSPAPAPAPTPAAPLLASTLFSDMVRQKRRRRCVPGLDRLRTGCAQIDEDVLGGGLERGIVCGVSAGMEQGAGRLLTFHILITALLSDPHVTATIIDSTGSFPLLLLSEVLQHRVSENAELDRRRQESGGHAKPEQSRDPAEEKGRIDKLVKGCLGRVAISRVFDVEGVWEVLSEVGRRCERSAREAGDGDVTSATDMGPAGDETSDEGVDMSLVPDSGDADAHDKADGDATAKMKTEIIDSEEEDDDDVSLSPKQTSPLPQHSGSDRDMSRDSTEIIKHEEANDVDAASDRSEETNVMVVIDDMTTLINTLFSKTERTSAHTILASLSRALHSLCRRHALLILLLNGLTTPKRSQATDTRNSTSGRAKASGKRGVSIFSSTASKPALGHTFSSLLDLHLLITPVPQRRVDAEMLYGGGARHEEGGAQDADVQDEGGGGAEGDDDAPGRATPKQQQRISHAQVLEVLHDSTPPLLSLLLPASPNSRSTNTTTITTTADEDIWQQMQGRRRQRREQRWAAFETGLRGLDLRSAAVERWVGHCSTHRDAGDGGEVGIGAGVGVGNVAKIFGFGGRRV